MEGHGEDEDGEAEAEAGDLDTLATRRTRSRRTNGHGGSQTILDLYQRVSDKEDKDQEILLNLIEQSKEPKTDRNYVTKIPKTKKPVVPKKKTKAKKRKFKIIKEIDSQEKLRKRKKLIDKIKEKRKPSHIQVNMQIISARENTFAFSRAPQFRH